MAMSTPGSPLRVGGGSKAGPVLRASGSPKRTGAVPTAAVAPRTGAVNGTIGGAARSPAGPSPKAALVVPKSGGALKAGRAPSTTGRRVVVSSPEAGAPRADASRADASRADVSRANAGAGDRPQVLRKASSKSLGQAVGSPKAPGLSKIESVSNVVVGVNRFNATLGKAASVPKGRSDKVLNMSYYELILTVFRTLDTDGFGRIRKQSLKRFAVTLGLNIADERWNREYEAIHQEFGWDDVAGISISVFSSLVQDKRRPLYASESDLRKMILALKVQLQTISRAQLIEHVFCMCDLRCIGSLSEQGLRRFVESEAIGFDQGDDAWKEEYARLCAEEKAER